MWVYLPVVSSQSVNTRYPGDWAKTRININWNRINFNQSIVNHSTTVYSQIYCNPLSFIWTFWLTFAQPHPPLIERVEGIIPSDPSLATTLAWAVPVASTAALIIFILSFVFLRKFRIYRLTNRNRTVVRLSRDIFHPESYANNTYYKSVDLVTSQNNGIASQSLFLLREWIELQEEIGEGCFGKVFRGRLRRPDSSPSPTDPAYINLESGEAVAIKVLKNPSAISSTTTQQELLQEAEIMAKFSHDNILSLRGVVINGTVSLQVAIKVTRRSGFSWTETAIKLYAHAIA